MSYYKKAYYTKTVYYTQPYYKKAEESSEEDDNRCWDGYETVPGKETYSEGSCRKKD